MESLFFRHRATSAPRSWRRPGFLICRRSGCWQPDIFPTICNTSKYLKNPGPKVDRAQPLRIPAAAGWIFAWAVRPGAIQKRPHRAGRPSESGYGRRRGHLREPQRPRFFLLDPRRRPEKRRNPCRYALQRDARGATRSAHQKPKKSPRTAPDLGMVPKGQSRHEF